MELNYCIIELQNVKFYFPNNNQPRFNLNLKCLQLTRLQYWYVDFMKINVIYNLFGMRWYNIIILIILFLSFLVDLPVFLLPILINILIKFQTKLSVSPWVPASCCKLDNCSSCLLSTEIIMYSYCRWVKVGCDTFL